MADNLTTTTTVSTVPASTVISTDDIAGVHVQRVKLACGPDGTATDVPVGGGVEAAALRVTIASDSTGVLSIDDNGGAITVDGTVAVTNASLTTIAGAVSGTEMQVDVVAALPAGTNAIGKLAANSGVDIGDVDVVSLTGSSVAHDAADSGNPHKIGGKARTTNPTAVADADRVDAAFDDLGRIVVVPHQVRDLVGQQATTISNSTTETTIVTAAASTYHDLTALTLTNATGTAVVCSLRDDTAGTVVANYALAANGGAALTFPVPFKQGATNDNWTITLSALAITVYVVAHYVKNA